MSAMQSHDVSGTPEHHRTNEELVLTVKYLEMQGHSAEEIAPMIERTPRQVYALLCIARFLDETLLCLLDAPMAHATGEKREKGRFGRSCLLGLDVAELVARLPLSEQRAFVEAHVLPKADTIDKTRKEIYKLARERGGLDCRFKPMEEQRFSPEEQGELDTVCRKHQAWIRRMAHSFFFTLSPYTSVEEDDLVQAGMLALCDAWRRRDPSKGAEDFRGFARVSIKGAFVDCLRQLDPLSRGDRRKVKALTRAINGNPRIERTLLAQELGVTLPKLEELFLLRSVRNHDRRGEVLGQEEDECDLLPGESEDPADLAALSEGISRIENMLAKSPHLAEIFRRCFEEEEALASVAADWGMSKYQISQLVREIRSIIRESLGD